MSTTPSEEPEKHHENCKMAWAVPPSPLMISKGNVYYTCSHCGEKVAKPIEPNTNKQEDQSDVSDKTEQYRARLMNKHSGEWDMEKVSAIAHLCVEVEPLVRKFANCDNENCITCPDNAESMSLFINARQDRAVAEERDAEIRKDEHSHMKWLPDEAKWIENEADRLEAIKRKRGE